MALGEAQVTPVRCKATRAGLLRSLTRSLPLQNSVWPGGQQEYLTKDNGDSSAGECSLHLSGLHLYVPGITLLGCSFYPIPYSLIHMLNYGRPFPILSFRKLLYMLQNLAVKLSLTVPGPV